MSLGRDWLRWLEIIENAERGDDMWQAKCMQHDALVDNVFFEPTLRPNLERINNASSLSIGLHVRGLRGWGSFTKKRQPKTHQISFGGRAPSWNKESLILREGDGTGGGGRECGEAREWEGGRKWERREPPQTSRSKSFYGCGIIVLCLLARAFVMCS